MSSRKGWHLILFMEEKICSFFGHRKIETSEALEKKLEETILKAIEYGCETFYFGGYGEFDALCHKTLLKIKKRIPEYKIKLTYCVAMEKYLRKNVRYFKRDDYDEIIYLCPSFSGWYKSIYFRNCAMIDKSDYIIFYAENKEGSGAYKALKYATGKEDTVLVNLFQ